MPALQTTYPGEHRPALVGTIANQEPHNVISRTVEVSVPFGAVVVQGASDLTVKPAAAGAAFRGIAVTDTAVPVGSGDAYPAGYTAAVLVKGVIWVVAAANVAAGQPAFFDAATGAISADTADIAIPNSMFDSSAAAGGLVKLRLA